MSKSKLKKMSKASKPHAAETTPPTLLQVAPVSTVPPTTTGLTAVAVGPQQVDLSWDAVPDATTYWIYRDTYVPWIVPTTTYSDHGNLAAPLVPGTTYTYRIAAVINSVLRQQSEPAVVTLPNE